MFMVDDDPSWVERFERRKDEERATLSERYPQLVTFVPSRRCDFVRGWCVRGSDICSAVLLPLRVSM
jgi:hypothetical protein